jgi:hypothetical protein
MEIKQTIIMAKNKHDIHMEAKKLHMALSPDLKFVEIKGEIVCLLPVGRGLMIWEPEATISQWFRSFVTKKLTPLFLKHDIAFIGVKNTKTFYTKSFCRLRWRVIRINNQIFRRRIA